MLRDLLRVTIWMLKDTVARDAQVWLKIAKDGRDVYNKYG